MADGRCRAPDNSSEMKDMTNISDNIQDNSDQDEEERILDPDHVEERFRVDRRKLEQMIQQGIKFSLRVRLSRSRYTTMTLLRS